MIDAGEEPAEDGRTARTPYIVLEYVDGETLKQLIRREGPLDIPQAIAYAIEIARALGAAHERLIVHRDVKPQNVLIGEEGGAKITDFGIARTLTEEGLTVAGRVLGTTDYVSPEQALGQPVTGQSDLYSLGIVLYEMLTGEVPFTGETPVAVAMRHVREQLPDVQLLRPDVSAATASVVDRATAKDLDVRYADAESMAADLEEVLAIEAARAGQATGEATSVLRTLPGSARRRLPWRMRHPARWLASLALLGAIVAIALIAAARHAHSGTGVASGVHGSAGLQPVALGQTAAHDYNPFGTEPENRDRVQNVIDSDPNTVWSTEHYYEGTLEEAGRRRRRRVPRRRAQPRRTRRRDPDADARLRRADLRRQEDQPVLRLRRPDAAVGARLAGAARLGRGRAKPPAHHAQRRLVIPLLPGLADDPPPRPAVRFDLRNHTVQVTQ